jgi:hypothetical protein
LAKIELPHDILPLKQASAENRERILKTVREKKQITYKGKPIKITADFSTKTLKARRTWSEVFWTLMNTASTLGYSTQQNYHSNRWSNKSLPQRTEIKRIYDHQVTTTKDSSRNSAHRK